MLAPILIKAGQTQSEPILLGHFSIAAVAMNVTEPFTLRFLASFDGDSYYVMHKADGRSLKAEVTENEAIMLIFDCTDFEGPQYIKFTVDKPLKKDLWLAYWKKEIRA